MPRIMWKCAVFSVLAALCLFPLAMEGQAAEPEGMWKLAEIVDIENREYWEAVKPEDFWQHEHSYARGSYSFRVWHRDEENYVAYGAAATVGAPPDSFGGGETVTLQISVSETENTDKWYTSYALAAADFAPPERDPGQLGDVLFLDAEGARDVSINGAGAGSASASVSAVVPRGTPGDRIALRLSFYGGLAGLATYYIYEWRDGTPAATAPQTTAAAPTEEPAVRAVQKTTGRKINESGVRFAGLSGQVEVRPDSDEDAWDFAGMDTVLKNGDRIRTGPRSGAIISFSDLSTFVMKPDTEIVLVITEEKETKLQLVAGNIWANVKKLLKDGTMETTMNQAVAGIKGTVFVCGENGGVSTLQVIEGTVEFTALADGRTVTVAAGGKVTASETGLGPQETFDAKAEQATWDAFMAGFPAAPSRIWIPAAAALLLVLGGAGFLIVWKSKKTKR